MMHRLIKVASLLLYGVCSFAMAQTQYKVERILTEDANGIPTSVEIRKTPPGAVVTGFSKDSAKSKKHLPKIVKFKVSIDHVQSSGYHRLFPDISVINALDPKQPIPAGTNLGSTSKTFLLQFKDNDVQQSCDWKDERSMAHKGRWVTYPDQSATARVFEFGYTDNGGEHWFKTVPPIVKETVTVQPAAAGSARIVGNFCFDGRTLQEKVCYISETDDRAFIAEVYKPIPGHEGYTPRLAIPFRINGYYFSGKLNDFVYGGYEMVGRASNPGINADHVIYIEGGKIHWPKVTYELCKRDYGGGRVDHVGFMVISTRDDYQALPTKGTLNSKDILPDGNFVLKPVILKKDENGVVKNNEETWEQLLVDRFINPSHEPDTFTRTSPGYLPSLIGLSSRYFQLDTNVGEVAEMQEKVEAINQNIHSIASQHPDANSVLVLGYTGVGKSTLINLLLGGDNNLKIKSIEGVIRLVADRDYAEVGHGRDRGTGEPKGFWWSVDPMQKLALWDTVGLGDASSEQDIITAYNLKRVFKSIGNGNVKIIMVADEHSITEREVKFLKLLNDITRVFTNIKQVKDVISSLVVTKYDRESDIKVVLNGIITEQQKQDALVSSGKVRKIPALSENARELVKHLADPVNTRVIIFPGIAHGSREGALIQEPYPHGVHIRNAVLKALIANTKGVVSPTVEPLAVIDNNSKSTELGKVINEKVASYLETGGTEAIVRLAQSMISDNTKPVSELKKDIKGIHDKLKLIKKDSTSADAFLEDLTKIFGSTGFFDCQLIKDSVDSLKFLSAVDSNVKAEFKKLWAQNLDHSIEALAEFGKALDISDRCMKIISQDAAINGKIIRYIDIKGIIVGASDINSYFSDDGDPADNPGIKIPDATLVTVNATNTFFVDANVNRSGLGTSFKISAPCWSVLGAHEFDLTGKKGSTGDVGSAGGTDAVGGDGRPGKPGQNGGNFFGYGFKFSGIDSLTVKSNGGQGGDGGQGGRGGNGHNADRKSSGTINQGVCAHQGMYCPGQKAIWLWEWDKEPIYHNVSKRHDYMDANKVDVIGAGERKIKDWIGGDWHHVIDVYGHRVTLKDAPQGGAVGKSGGKGGQKGKGGKAGKITLAGAQLKLIEQEDGKEGSSAGRGGDGGTGGIHQVYKRDAWLCCRQGNQADKRFDSIWADRESGPHWDIDAGSEGTPTEVSSVAPDEPIDLTKYFEDVDSFSTLLKTHAANPNTAPWVLRAPWVR